MCVCLCAPRFTSVNKMNFNFEKKNPSPLFLSVHDRHVWWLLYGFSHKPRADRSFRILYQSMKCLEIAGIMLQCLTSSITKVSGNVACGKRYARQNKKKYIWKKFTTCAKIFTISKCPFFVARILCEYIILYLKARERCFIYMKILRIKRLYNIILSISVFVDYIKSSLNVCPANVFSTTFQKQIFFLRT